MKAKKAAKPRRSTNPRVKESAGVYGAAFKTEGAPELRDIAEKFGLRQDVLSRMTGFSVRAVAGWARGEKPSAPVRRALTEMDRLLDSLSRLMKPKEVGKWLKEPNAAFDGSTPVQVIERGQIDRIWRMLYFVEAGEPG
jgi:hypothetical protein